jgi:hypothetical protein
MSGFQSKPLIKRFAIVYPLACLGVGILMIILDNFTDDSSNMGMSFIAVYASGADLGQQFYKRERRLPTKSECWQLARMTTVVLILWSIVFTVIMIMLSPKIAATLGLVGFIILLLVVGLISLVVLRWFIGLGAKGMIKQEERKARKLAKRKARQRDNNCSQKF